MTGTGGQVPPGDPVEDPLSLQLLADLHAGVLDARLAARVRCRVAADAQARAVLAALDATVADLAELPGHQGITMPDELARRLDAALAAEARCSGHPAADPPGPVHPPTAGIPTAPVADLAARHRRRLTRFSVGLLAAAAVVVVVMLSVVRLADVPLEISGIPRADDALGTAVAPSEPLALTSSNLGGALDQALVARDFGPLSAPGMVQGCLAANGVADSEPLGALDITLDGRRGVLIVLPTGRIAEFRLLVVGPDCGPGNPSPLADTVVGRR